MRDRADRPPRDLPVQWTADGFVCELRPLPRRAHDLGQGMLLVTFCAGLLFVWPVTAAVFLLLSLGWLYLDWRRSQAQRDRRLVLTLTAHRLEVVVTGPGGRALASDRILLTAIREVRASSSGIVLSVGGRAPVQIPLERVSTASARYVGRLIEGAAETARARQDAPAEIPVGMRQLLQKEGAWRE